MRRGWGGQIISSEQWGDRTEAMRTRGGLQRPSREPASSPHTRGNIYMLHGPPRLAKRPPSARHRRHTPTRSRIIPRHFASFHALCLSFTRSTLCHAVSFPSVYEPVVHPIPSHLLRISSQLSFSTVHVAMYSYMSITSLDSTETVLLLVH